jgi:cytochrome oxidase Cu insertion factor (SCO1/SenC/PrrC family)
VPRLLPDDPVKRGRVKLALLLALFAIPLVAAWAIYVSGWMSGTAANYGTLLQPRLLEDPALVALRGKWVLVSFDRAACEASCEQKLYYMRQVRRAQGRQMNRIERLWIVTDAAAPAPALLAAIEGTHLVRDGEKLAGAFPAERAATDHIYLVDPLGNLMLRFPRDPNPSKIVKDLERLLKYSGFG